ncbi:MAG: hypothetical protein KGO50_05915 [Myxococcales bacterium]|nr:hypothetical protein [Myxococcales bacterium]
MSESSVPRPESRWGRKGALTLAALAALSTAHCGGGTATPDEQPGSMPMSDESTTPSEPSAQESEISGGDGSVEPADPSAQGGSAEVMVPMYGMPADVPVPMPPEEGSADAGEGSADTAEPEVVPPSRSMPMPVYGGPPR